MPKQIDLTNVFVTTAALSCQRVIVNKQMLTCIMLMLPPQSLQENKLRLTNAL